MNTKIVDINDSKIYVMNGISHTLSELNERIKYITMLKDNLDIIDELHEEISDVDCDLLTDEGKIQIDRLMDDLLYIYNMIYDRFHTPFTCDHKFEDLLIDPYIYPFFDCDIDSKEVCSEKPKHEFSFDYHKSLDTGLINNQLELVKMFISSRLREIIEKYSKEEC